MLTASILNGIDNLDEGKLVEGYSYEKVTLGMPQAIGWLRRKVTYNRSEILESNLGPEAQAWLKKNEATVLYRLSMLSNLEGAWSLARPSIIVSKGRSSYHLEVPYCSRLGLGVEGFYLLHPIQLPFIEHLSSLMRQLTLKYDFVALQEISAEHNFTVNTPMHKTEMGLRLCTQPSLYETLYRLNWLLKIIEPLGEILEAEAQERRA